MSDSYEIKISEKARRSLASIDRTQAKNIGEKIRWLAENIEETRHKPLKGKKWAGIYRYRVGDYRFMYSLDHDGRILNVVRIGHRKNVYDE